MKILIVEDEPSLRELIQRSLEKERYVVETAGDFNSALCKIEDYDYDCVLLDIMLTDGDLTVVLVTTDDTFDPGIQFGQMKRFREVVVRSQFQS